MDRQPISPKALLFSKLKNLPKTKNAGHGQCTLSFEDGLPSVPQSATKSAMAVELATPKSLAGVKGRSSVQGQTGGTPRRLTTIMLPPEKLITPFVVNKTVGNDEGRPMVDLEHWTIKPYGHGFCVEGHRCFDAEGKYWRSTAIEERLHKRAVRSVSGVVYKLVGPVVELLMLSAGFPEIIVKQFRRGFPSNWQALLSRHTRENKSIKHSVSTPRNRSNQLDDSDNYPDVTATTAPCITTPRSARLRCSSTTRSASRTPRASTSARRALDTTRLVCTPPYAATSLEKSRSAPAREDKQTSCSLVLYSPKTLLTPHSLSQVVTDLSVCPTSRRSGRHIIPTLSWWANERVHIDPITNDTQILRGCSPANVTALPSSGYTPATQISCRSTASIVAKPPSRLPDCEVVLTPLRGVSPRVTRSSAAKMRVGLNGATCSADYIRSNETNARTTTTSTSLVRMRTKTIHRVDTHAEVTRSGNVRKIRSVPTVVRAAETVTVSVKRKAGGGRRSSCHVTRSRRIEYEVDIVRFDKTETETRLGNSNGKSEFQRRLKLPDIAAKSETAARNNSKCSKSVSPTSNSCSKLDRRWKASGDICNKTFSVDDMFRRQTRSMTRNESGKEASPVTVGLGSISAKDAASNQKAQRVDCSTPKQAKIDAFTDLSVNGKRKREVGVQMNKKVKVQCAKTKVDVSQAPMSRKNRGRERPKHRKGCRKMEVEETAGKKNAAAKQNSQQMACSSPKQIKIDAFSDVSVNGKRTREIRALVNKKPKVQCAKTRVDMSRAAKTRKNRGKDKVEKEKTGKERPTHTKGHGKMEEEETVARKKRMVRRNGRKAKKMAGNKVEKNRPKRMQVKKDKTTAAGRQNKQTQSCSLPSKKMSDGVNSAKDPSDDLPFSLPAAAGGRGTLKRKRYLNQLLSEMTTSDRQYADIFDSSFEGNRSMKRPRLSHLFDDLNDSCFHRPSVARRPITPHGLYLSTDTDAVDTEEGCTSPMTAALRSVPKNIDAYVHRLVKDRSHRRRVNLRSRISTVTSQPVTSAEHPALTTKLSDTLACLKQQQCDNNNNNNVDSDEELDDYFTDCL